MKETLKNAFASVAMMLYMAFWIAQIVFLFMLAVITADWGPEPRRVRRRK